MAKALFNGWFKVIRTGCIVTGLLITIGVTSFGFFWGFYTNLEAKVVDAKDASYPKASGVMLESRMDRLENNMNERFNKSDDKMNQMVHLQQQMIIMAKEKLYADETNRSQ